MIPRYNPTYTFSDLYTSLKISYQRSEDVNAALAARIADLYKTKHVFLVDSGRSALYLLLKAYDRPGGVLFPAYTCRVVPEAVRYSGYDPILLDVDENSFNLPLESIRRAVTPKITVCLATHLLGMPTNVLEMKDLLKGSGVLLVEDAAPAMGAEIDGKLVGTFGDAAILSFHVAKAVSGETGGAILTNRDDLAEGISAFLAAASPPEPKGFYTQFVRAFLRKLISLPSLYSTVHRTYRTLQKETMYELVPLALELPADYLRQCSRFSSSLILAQMDRLVFNMARRRKLASIYQNETKKIPWLRVPPLTDGCAPAWLQYSIFTEDKWGFYKYMQSNGIDLSWTYRYSCAESLEINGFPNSKRAAQSVLGLPTYPSLTDQQAEKIVYFARNYSRS